MNSATLPQVEEVQEVPCMKTKDVLIKNGFRPLCSSPDKERKNFLLKTQMNKLGLGRAFDRYFLDESEKKYFIDGSWRRMGQKDVLTVQEFIILNQNYRRASFLRTRKSEFKGGHYSLLNTETSSFFKLVNLLKEAGFNHQDWSGISFEKRKPCLENMEKAEIINLPALEILGIYGNCSPAKTLESYFNKYQGRICVKDIMQLTDKTAEKMTDIMPALQKAQRRLRRFGFTDEDGAFMRAHLDF